MNQTLRMALAILLLFGMAGVLVQALLLVKAPPANAGFSQPEATRILFLHVPCAELCTLGFVLAFGHAVAYLRSRDPRQDARSLVAVRLGLLFGALALGMGMMWAKVEWGAPWNWDPRETGLALALLSYLTYLALRESVGDPERAGVLAAVYAVLACPTALFLVFGLPRMLDSLHPRPGQTSLPGAYGMTIAASMLAFTGLFGWLYVLETRITLIAWQHEGRIEG